MTNTTAPDRPHWLVRILAAGCALAATPFGAPVHPHAVAGLLRAEARR